MRNREGALRIMRSRSCCCVVFMSEWVQGRAIESGVGVVGEDDDGSVGGGLEVLEG